MLSRVTMISLTLLQLGTGVKAMSADMQGVLDKHNVYRCMHQVPPFTWDDAVAAKAQAWADKGTNEHSPIIFEGVVNGEQCGENLAWGHPTKSGTDSTIAWYDEIQYTDPYGTASSFEDSNPAGKDIGPYTQLVWKGLTKLGCGKGSATVSGITGDYWVCQYCTVGHIQGAFEGNVFAPTQSYTCCGGTASDVPSSFPTDLPCGPAPTPIETTTFSITETTTFSTTETTTFSTTETTTFSTTETSTFSTTEIMIGITDPWPLTGIEKAIDFDRDDDVGFNEVANLAYRFPSLSVRLDNLDLATLTAAGKEMVHKAKSHAIQLFAHVMSLAMAELPNVRSFFSAGSVLLTIVLEETDPAQAALFQSALAAKSGELATSVAQGVSEVPGISAVSTGPITGAVALPPSGSDPTESSFLPVLPVLPEMPAPGASMPNNVAAANQLAIQAVTAGLLNNHEQGGEVPVWKSTWGLVATSTMAVVLVALVMGMITFRSHGASVVLEQVLEEEWPINE